MRAVLVRRMFVETACSLALCAVLLSAVAGCGGDAPKATVSEASQLFISAKESAAAGDTEKAVDLFTQAIAVNPTPFAYRDRAVLLVKLGRQDEALKDCEAALALAPDAEDPTLKWLAGELKKPAGSRFQGKFKDPPKFDH